MSEVPANMEDGDYVGKVFAKSESESIALSIRGRVFMADWEKGELEQLFTLPEQPEMVIFVDDRMLCLGNSGVTSYDMAQGITLEKDAVLDEFAGKNGAKLNNSSDSYGGILFPGEDGAIYVAYSGGCTVMWKTAMPWSSSLTEASAALEILRLDCAACSGWKAGNSFF